jgi:putative alpha-1,2-mannosidase
VPAGTDDQFFGTGKMRQLFISVLLLLAVAAQGQVNIFLGTSGDHGQLSPAASYPFSMLDIGPQTYPNTHTGYEHKAKLFLGFTHGRLEGVGCMGSGGNLLLKPFMNSPTNELFRKTENGSPGFYAVSFANGIRAQMTLKEKAGLEQYHFPVGKHGFYIDLSHAFMNGFKAERHEASAKGISGWIESGTTCQVGTYRIYYDLEFDQAVRFADSTAHTFTIMTSSPNVTIRVAFSSVSTAYAKADINRQSFARVKTQSKLAWNELLNSIKVSGDPAEAKLFYSLLYRCFHAPFAISESDGSYRGSDGSLQHTTAKAYSSWTIWDNYKTALPLLSIIQPGRYQDMVTSIANLYRFGKRNWATQNEPSNTVRTEHAIVVLLDAYRKGYRVDFKSIRDSLLAETDHLDFSRPDKALESSYDTWGMAQILAILHEDSLSKVYLAKAANWKTYWNKDFKDLTKSDVDDLNARHMYQGTIWQYRWFAPFDMQGLIEACGGEAEYLKQLDAFFAGDYYNAANEPDIQVPYLYNGTSHPWQSQDVIRKYAKDTVIQYYEDDNYRGIDPQIGRVYNNRPDGFLQTMDDDMGAMSAWYVLAAIGLSPACPGWPVYYLQVPLFSRVDIDNFHIRVLGNGRYIRSATLNGKPLDRNWITQQEIMQGGKLVIVAGEKPNRSFGIQDQWITNIEKY